MQAYVVANRLATQVLLTYEERPKDALKDLQALMKASRRMNGPHPWLAVPELGELGGIHYHLMVRYDIDADALAAKWGRGMTSIVHLPTIGDLKRYCGYLGKHFDECRSHRPFARRYIPAPGFKPEWIDYGYATRDEAEILAQSQAGDSWATVRRWSSDSDWCAGGFEWDLDTPCPGGQVEDNETFFRRVGATACEALL